jgi:hypothetical protein
MVRVITNGGTARIVLERTASGSDELGAVVAGVRDCADAGVEELVIAVPEAEHGWLQVLEEALLDTPDPLRIWVAVGEDDLDDDGRALPA